MKHKTTADDVRQVILAAVSDALDDGKQEARKKPGLTGVRAVATGAVLYTAGRAAIAGRRFYRDHFGPDGEEHDETEDDEPRAASDDEEYVDGEAEDDDEPQDEREEDEPRARRQKTKRRAERDEDEDEDEYDDEYEDDEDDEPSAADRPPVHGDGGGDDEDADSDLPPRPSRRRKPVKT